LKEDRAGVFIVRLRVASFFQNAADMTNVGKENAARCAGKARAPTCISCILVDSVERAWRDGGVAARHACNCDFVPAAVERMRLLLVAHGITE
jgi:hypothetical protein